MIDHITHYLDMGELGEHETVVTFAIPPRHITPLEMGDVILLSVLLHRMNLIDIMPRALIEEIRERCFETATQLQEQRAIDMAIDQMREERHA